MWPASPAAAEVAGEVVPVTGVAARSRSEASRNCGVWAAMLYWVPLFGSIQKDSVVCELPDSDTRRSEATSVSDSPSSAALLRSTSTLRVG